jgi:hypothetical protein
MRLLDRLFPPPPPHAGSYAVSVVSLPEELDHEKSLPAELRFVFQADGTVKPRLRELLAAGKAIGIRTVLRTPESLLHAVRQVAELSQHNCVLTWLTPLLRDKHRPHFAAADVAAAAAKGVDLDGCVETILAERTRFKRFVLIDEENAGIGDEDRRFMQRLSELAYPLAVDHIAHRVAADNAHERTAVAQNIIKAMFVIGPIAHTLEHYAQGVGKVFAASADDLLGEAAEISALRGSGFSWKVLIKRGRILIPVFALATYGAFQVEPLIQGGHELLGGAVFGFSAVALSLTTAIQSIFLYRHSVDSLKAEGKLHDHGPSMGHWKLAIIQDFSNPARLGLMIGACMAPLMGMLGAALGILHNGWALAAIGSTESIVAGITVMAARHIDNWRLRRRFERYAARGTTS